MIQFIPQIIRALASGHLTYPPASYGIMALDQRVLHCQATCQELIVWQRRQLQRWKTHRERTVRIVVDDG